LAKAAPDKRDGSDSKTSYGGKTKGYWSGYATRHSNALDLESQVFASDSPRQIARSLKRWAERSKKAQGHAVSVSDVDAELFLESAKVELDLRDGTRQTPVL
jgi:Protein of unknown function (DUF3175)